MNLSAAEVALVPTGVLTVTSTVPAPSGGALAVTEVAELNTTLVAGSEPKLTPLRSVRSVPVMVTEVPPDSGPALRLSR